MKKRLLKSIPIVFIGICIGCTQKEPSIQLQEPVVLALHEDFASYLEDVTTYTIQGANIQMNSMDAKDVQTTINQAIETCNANIKKDKDGNIIQFTSYYPTILKSDSYITMLARMQSYTYQSDAFLEEVVAYTFDLKTEKLMTNQDILAYKDTDYTTLNRLVSNQILEKEGAFCEGPGLCYPKPNINENSIFYLNTNNEITIFIRKSTGFNHYQFEAMTVKL